MSGAVLYFHIFKIANIDDRYINFSTDDNSYEPHRIQIFRIDKELNTFRFVDFDK